MINDIERWKQNRNWLEEIEMRLNTIRDFEDDPSVRQAVGENLTKLHGLWLFYDTKIKSRETLRKALEDSLASPVNQGDDKP